MKILTLEVNKNITTMELKKNPRADLRQYAGLFFEVGLAVALGVVLASFNYANHERNRMVFGDIDNFDIEDVMIPITRSMPVTPPPAPPKTAEVITIIESESDLEEDFDIVDIEATQETMVAIIERSGEEEEEEEVPFALAEVRPEFPGGEVALQKYIASHVQYPEIARENGLQGKVFVQFVINKRGEVENVIIARGVDAALDKEALRVIQGLPKWKPGVQRGKPVRVSYTVPINFKLN
jgi:protein TonB